MGFIPCCKAKSFLLKSMKTTPVSSSCFTRQLGYLPIAKIPVLSRKNWKKPISWQHAESTLDFKNPTIMRVGNFIAFKVKFLLEVKTFLRVAYMRTTRYFLVLYGLKWIKIMSNVLCASGRAGNMLILHLLVLHNKYQFASS